MIKRMKKKWIITCLVLALFLAGGTVAYAANLITKSLSGSIEIVTSSGGGSGTTTPPDSADIEILNILNFTEIPTTGTEGVIGLISVKNNTGSDLYFGGGVATINGSIGSMLVTDNTTGSTTILAGETQILGVTFNPVGGGMTPGNYDYDIVLSYSY